MGDAQALGCWDEVCHAREIVKRGSSACRQLEVYNAQGSNGARKRDALKAVVDQLVAETVEGL